MKIVDRTLNNTELLRLSAGLNWEQALFFDIETTGLNWKRSHLYLIGAMWILDGTLRFRQWFALKPSDEEEMLRDFLQTAAGYTILVHYNGTTFDIPYLCHKCSFYGLNPLPLQDKSCDLYQQFRPLKGLLGLENMKLKTVEKALGLVRKDTCTGEELIKIYKTWIAAQDPRHLDMLLLHNAEDVIGMTRLQTLYTLLALRQGTLSLSVGNVTDETDYIKLFIQPEEPLPVSKCFTVGEILLEITPEELVLTVPKYTGTLKHYYKDYKNYYYLPKEDKAIHKSVGVYVDPDYREKARPDNCYDYCTGTFLPQLSTLYTPDFYFSREEKISWFLYTPDFMKNGSTLHKYAYSLIKSLLSGKI